MMLRRNFFQILKQLLEIRADPEDKRAFLDAIPSNVAAAAYGEPHREMIRSDSNLSNTTAPTIFSGTFGLGGDQIPKHTGRRDSSSRASNASLKLHDQSIQSIFGQRKNSVQLSVNMEPGKNVDDNVDHASIVAYIIPMREKEAGMLRRSRSSEDIRIKQAILQMEAENEYRGGVQSAGEEGEVGRQKTLKLLADRSVISVTCEKKKRSKSFEAASLQRDSKVSPLPLDSVAHSDSDLNRSPTSSVSTNGRRWIIHDTYPMAKRLEPPRSYRSLSQRWI